MVNVFSRLYMLAATQTLWQSEISYFLSDFTIHTILTLGSPCRTQWADQGDTYFIILEYIIWHKIDFETQFWSTFKKIINAGVLIFFVSLLALR